MAPSDQLEGKAQAFDHGLNEKQVDTIHDISIDISRMILGIEERFPRHRNLSLVTTKLEEAKLWLMDRLHKPA